MQTTNDLPQAVSTHSRLKAAGVWHPFLFDNKVVSTHSRLKAAGDSNRCGVSREFGFNTQPPKGGWQFLSTSLRNGQSFNTQPPKGGWKKREGKRCTLSGFNTQPPKGGWLPFIGRFAGVGRFNTQPPKGGWSLS